METCKLTLGSYFVYQMQMRTHCLSIVLWVIVLLFDVFCSYYLMSSVSATPSKSLTLRRLFQQLFILWAEMKADMVNRS